MKHARKAFSGSIQYVSLSPHGSPEGIVLDDGSFVKTPPHSVVDEKLFVIGTKVSGEGEILGETPNQTYHHALVKAGTKLLANDAGTKEEREQLKDKHKNAPKDHKGSNEELMTLKGQLVAVATTPKGDVDRFIFEDGTSVHISKDIEMSGEDCAIGVKFEVKGKSRLYGNTRFMKADSVKAL